jgi:hypothetical protein
MEVVASDVERSHVGVGDGDALLVEIFVDFATNGEAGLDRRRGDEVDDDAIADERAGTPGLTDVREEAVLDLVPLAGALWQVVDFDADTDLVGQHLQLTFPQADARAIAAAAIGGNQQPLRLGIALPADLVSPATDAMQLR